MNKSIPEVDSQLVQKLVVANRILAHQGVVDGFGHVSVRHGEVTNAFLLSRSRAPALITEQDIGCYDLDGEALGAVAGAQIGRAHV